MDKFSNTDEFSDGERVCHITWTADITGRPLVGQVGGGKVVWDGGRGQDELANVASYLVRI